MSRMNQIFSSLWAWTSQTGTPHTRAAPFGPVGRWSEACCKVHKTMAKRKGMARKEDVTAAPAVKLLRWCSRGTVKALPQAAAQREAGCSGRSMVLGRMRAPLNVPCDDQRWVVHCPRNLQGHAAPFKTMHTTLQWLLQSSVLLNMHGAGYTPARWTAVPG